MCNYRVGKKQRKARALIRSLFRTRLSMCKWHILPETRLVDKEDLGKGERSYLWSQPSRGTFETSPSQHRIRVLYLFLYRIFFLFFLCQMKFCISNPLSLLGFSCLFCVFSEKFCLLEHRRPNVTKINLYSKVRGYLNM